MNSIHIYFFELKIRWFYIIISLLTMFFFIFNLIENISTHYIFYNELDLNSIEYYKYSNLYFYKNSTIYLENKIEYDWYINYNIFFYKMKETESLISFYYYLTFIFISPYLLYEIWLFIKISLYKCESFIFRAWIFNNIFIFIYIIIYFDYIFTNIIFFWEENIDIFLNNEFNEIFITTNQGKNNYKLYIYIILIKTQLLFISYYVEFLFNKNKFNDKNIKKIIFFILLILIFIIKNILKIEFIFLIEKIIFSILITEIYILLYNIRDIKKNY